MVEPIKPHQWVTPRLALSGAIWENEVPLLCRDGITHVFDCRLLPSSEGLYASTGIRYKQCGIADDGKTKGDEWFFQGIQFVSDALLYSRSKVLIHCKFGMSRSPSMMYAVLRSMDVPPDDAAEQIRNARPVARVTYQADAERAVARWKRNPKARAQPPRKPT